MKFKFHAFLHPPANISKVKCDEMWAMEVLCAFCIQFETTLFVLCYTIIAFGTEYLSFSIICFSLKIYF